MERLFLLADIAGSKVAIPSEVIESVVTVGEIVPVPKCDPVLVGLFALRSRVLSLIDCQFRVTGERNLIERKCLAVVVSIGGYSFGLLVNQVRDVVSVPESKILPTKRVDSKWRELVDKIVEVDGDLLMVLDPEKFVNIAEPIAA